MHVLISFPGLSSASQNIHIVMELCSGGELFDKLKELGRYEERDAAGVMHTLLDVLAFCHEKGVVHRDVKPENVLLMSPNKLADVKIIDFGICATMKPGGCRACGFHTEHGIHGEMAS